MKSKGLNISVMKQEKVKLWGMFKLRSKHMKIILVSRDGDEYLSGGKGSQE